MQSTLLQVINLILLETAIATVIMISLAFYRLSENTRFRLWALGWNLYIANATLFALFFMDNSSTINLLLIPLASVGVLMIAFELNEGISKSIKHQYYLTSFILVFIWVSVCLIFNLPSLTLYIPLSFEMPIACYMSGNELMKVPIQPRHSINSIIIGLLLVASTSFLPSFAYSFDFLFILIMIHTTGLLIIGVSMYVLLYRYMDLKIKSQYNISRLMTRVIQHDIRNYIQIINNAVQLAHDNPSQCEYWLRLANDTVQQARKFIDDMREIEKLFSSINLPLSAINLEDLINEVLKRVMQEYELSEDVIRTKGIENIRILTNRLAHEIVWNIIDNAFKHGSQDIEISAIRSNDFKCILQIQDSAGGLDDPQLQYINSSRSDDIITPSTGLGLGLIKGLALLCDLELSAQNRNNSRSKPGTLFTLKFKCESNE